MIGLSAIFTLCMYMVFPGIMLIVGIKLRSILFTVITGVFMFIPCAIVFRTVADMWSLYTLEASEVAGLEVDGQSIIEPDKIGTIVDALNSPSFFMNNHGGWEVEAPVSITLKSGEIVTMHISPYLTEEGGAVVHLNREAYSSTLPKALEETGIYLPDGKNWKDIEGVKGLEIDPMSIRVLDKGTRAWVKLPVSRDYSAAYIVTVTKNGELLLEPGTQDGATYTAYQHRIGQSKKPGADDKIFGAIVTRLNGEALEEGAETPTSGP